MKPESLKKFYEAQGLIEKGMNVEKACKKVGFHYVTYYKVRKKVGKKARNKVIEVSKPTPHEIVKEKIIQSVPPGIEELSKRYDEIKAGNMELVSQVQELEWSKKQITDESNARLKSLREELELQKHALKCSQQQMDEYRKSSEQQIREYRAKSDVLFDLLKELHFQKPVETGITLPTEIDFND